jgi:hypothetical protein
MNRSKLEIASWIAGILSALIAAYALVSSRLPGELHTQVVLSPAQPAGPPSPESSATPATQALSDNSEASSIAEALASAKQIYATTTRDTELGRLARLAIARHEYPAALAATSAIYASTQRIELYDLIHCYSLNAGDKASASEAVKRAYSTSAKTAMLLRASSLVALKPEEGRNEVTCKAL